MIHRLSDSGDFHQTGDRQVLTHLHETNNLDELVEVLSLRRSQLVLLEERNDHVPKICEPPHAIPG